MRRAVLLAVAVLALGACGDSDPSSPTAEDLAKIDVSPDHTISVDDEGYEPNTLEVQAGEVILLVNDGDEAHSFTATNQRFDTGRMEPGDETTLVLVEPGTTTFRDVEAPGHEGTVTVVDGQ
jgi:plastocyanin